MIYFNHSIIISFFIKLLFFITHQFNLIIMLIIHFQILQFVILIIFNDFIAKIALQIHLFNCLSHDIASALLLLHDQLFNHEFLIINQIIDINTSHFLINYLFIFQLNISFHFQYLNNIF